MTLAPNINICVKKNAIHVAAVGVFLAKLFKESHGLKFHTVSFSCRRLFKKQTREYQHSVLRRQGGIPAIAVEAYAGIGWER